MPKLPNYSNKIEKNLLASSEEALKNGIALLEEANILYEHDRFARATSLAILGEEEFSKALILRIAIIQKRWDQELYDALKMHPHKQAISQALQKLVPELIGHLRKSMRTLIQTTTFPLNKRVDELKTEVAKNQIKRQRLDKLKQDAQFVAIGKTGIAARKPSSITKSLAAETLDRVTKFKTMTETLFGRAGDDHPLLRTESNLVHTSGETTIKHKSGFDIKMSIFDINEFPACREEMNPYFVLKEFPTIEPTDLTTDQREIFASLLIKYDGIGQMKEQQQELGLKSCQFLNDCEQLVLEIHDKHTISMGNTSKNNKGRD